MRTTRAAASNARAHEPPLAITASDGFVATPQVEAIAYRALAYLDAGYPVHLAGPAGTGKTTLAFHIAALRGRPVSLIHGHDGFAGTDLIGRDSGYRRSSTVDNYIHSVLKTDEAVEVNWSDNRLAKACRQGHTLIYDEFNRTRAEANNILLSLLEEGILATPQPGGGYLRVDPDFRIILTSNPVEYAGVHQTPDALLDRLVTIRCDHYDAATETGIVARASGLDADDAARIVNLVRVVREDRPQPTLRSAIALARVAAGAGVRVDPDDDVFAAMAWDMLGEKVPASLAGGRDGFAGLLRAALSAPAHRRRAA